MGKCLLHGSAWIFAFSIHSCVLKQLNSTFYTTMPLYPLFSFSCADMFCQKESRYNNIPRFLNCRLLSLQTNISSNHVVIFIVGRRWIVQCRWKPEYKLLKSCLPAKVHSVLEKHVCFSSERIHLTQTKMCSLIVLWQCLNCDRMIILDLIDFCRLSQYKFWLLNTRVCRPCYLNNTIILHQYVQKLAWGNISWTISYANLAYSWV